MDELCFEIDYIEEKIMEPIIATMVDYEVIESSAKTKSGHYHHSFKLNHDYYQNDSLPLTNNFKRSSFKNNSHSTKDDEQSLSLISRKNNIKYT